MMRRHGPKIDNYLGHAVYQSIEDEHGQLYVFHRYAECEADGGCPLNQLRTDERMVDPGVIYRWVENA